MNEQLLSLIKKKTFKVCNIINKSIIYFTKKIDQFLSQCTSHTLANSKINAICYECIFMMEKKLSGKVALVTGASSGIGFAIAQGLAENGAKVLISSRSRDNILKAEAKLQAKDLEVKGEVCDVSNEQQIVHLVKKCVETFGKLDIVVSNAGIMDYFGPILEIDDDEWQRHMNTNLKAGFLLAKESVPYLEETKGNIILIGSTMAFDPFQNVGMYSITKTALLSLIKVLSKELASKSIRVNGVNPGPTDTAMATKTYEELAKIAQKNGNNMTAEDMRNIVIDKIMPLKRLGQPDEMSGGVVFLASDDASYITGEILCIGGGCPTRL